MGGANWTQRVAILVGDMHVVVYSSNENRMTSFQDPSQWVEFLAAFSSRNHLRPASFERIDRRTMAAEGEAEGQEASLEKINVEFEGDDAPRIIVTRQETSQAKPRTLVTTIPNVKSLVPRFDVENIDERLEMENKDQVLTILRMKPKSSGKD